MSHSSLQNISDKLVLMAIIQEVISMLEKIAPKSFAFDYDKIGLQIGSPQNIVKKAIVSLDCSNTAVDFAIQQNAQLLISHHPLIWEPLNKVHADSHLGKIIYKLIQNNITFIAAHTNWDCANGGVNDTLAKKLGLEKISQFGQGTPQKHVTLVTNVPSTHTEQVIDACSQAGAGIIGNYNRCAYFSTGTGTFLPIEGANPTIGDVNKIEKTQEDRLEMKVSQSLIQKVEKALRQAHPYEEPAIDFLLNEDLTIQPIGRIGQLKQPMNLLEFSNFINIQLKTKCLVWGYPHQQISKVAVVGGSACSEWRAAQYSGADVLVTGEVKHHNAVEASENGMGLISAGHYATEQLGMVRLFERFSQELPNIEWVTFEPQAGLAGKPF